MASSRSTHEIIVQVKDEASRGFAALKDNIVPLTLGIAALAAGVKVATDAIKGLASFQAENIRLAIAQERAETKLAVALNAIGKGGAQAVDSAKRFASQLQSVTTHGDEAILEIESLLVTLGGLSGAGLERATKAAFAFADATGRDAASAATLLAKAAQGQTAELSRYGIVLAEGIPQNEKLAAVLELVEAKTKGVSEALAQTFEGRATQIAGLINDWREALGQLVTDNPAVLAAMTGIKESIERLLAAFKESVTGGFISAATEHLVRWALAATKATRVALQLAASPFFGSIPIPEGLIDGLKAMEEELLGIANRIAEVRRIQGLIDDFRGTGVMSEYAAERVAELEKELGLLGGVSADTRNNLLALTPGVEQVGAVADKTKEKLEGLADAFARISVIGRSGARIGGDDYQAYQLEQAARASEEQARAEAERQEQFRRDAAERQEIIELENIDILNRGRMLDEETGLWLSVADATKQAADAERKVAEHAEMMKGFMDIAGQAALQFGDILVEAAFGAKVAWGDFFKQLFKWIAQAIVRLLIMKAIQGAASGGVGAAFGAGGMVGGGGAGTITSWGGIATGTGTYYMASGGVVAGGIPNRDSVRAMLTPGEVVLSSPLVEKLESALSASPVMGAGFQVINQFNNLISRETVEAFVRAQNRLAEEFALDVAATRVV